MIDLIDNPWKRRRDRTYTTRGKAIDSGALGLGTAWAWIRRFVGRRRTVGQDVRPQCGAGHDPRRHDQRMQRQNPGPTVSCLSGHSSRIIVRGEFDRLDSGKFRVRGLSSSLWEGSVGDHPPSRPFYNDNVFSMYAESLTASECVREGLGTLGVPALRGVACLTFAAFQLHQYAR